jgi:hypothetical protein
MRNRRLLPASLLLFLSAGLLARAPSGFPGKAPGQDQPEKPKFYSRRVVCEKEVQNAKDSLGAPDGRYAEILPGGQLVVLMENELYSFQILDSGSVVYKGEPDYGLEGFFQIQDTPDKQQNYAWMIIHGDPWTPGGFRFAPAYSGYLFCGNTGVNMIRITNFGTKSLFVDAVIGYGIEAERR